MRFATLEAICEALDCQPGDLLEHKRAEDGDEDSPAAAASWGGGS
jgi:putative transcriptional regulator